jgi:hypothetical protein
LHIFVIDSLKKWNALTGAESLSYSFDEKTQKTFKIPHYPTAILIKDNKIVEQPHADIDKFLDQCIVSEDKSKK